MHRYRNTSFTILSPFGATFPSRAYYFVPITSTHMLDVLLSKPANDLF